jgi:hypothetical protein
MLGSAAEERAGLHLAGSATQSSHSPSGEQAMAKQVKPERISIELPMVPHSLRGFVERAVTDERFMLAFVESPGNALRSAGVPVDADCLTKADTDRLLLVLGRLRNLVASGKVARDFRFERVFAVANPVAYQEQTSHEETYAYKNFDHSTEGQSAENKSSTEGGIKTEFSKKGLTRIEDIFAPLISPGVLAEITALMEANLKVLER